MSETTPATLAEGAERRQRRTRPRPTRPRARARGSRRPPSGAAPRGRRTCSWTCSSAGSATRTCTRCANEWQGTMPTVYPCVPGHEIVGRVGEGGQRRPEVQGGRPGGGGLHGRLVPHLRRVPRRAGAVLRGPGDLHLQRARQAPRRRHLRRLLRQPRRRRGVRAARVGPASTRPARRRSCAPASPPTRRCGTGTSARDRRSASWASAGWGTWRVKFASAFGARVVVFTTSPGKAEDAVRLGAHEWWSPGTPRRCRSTRAASTSSWTRSRPRTT